MFTCSAKVKEGNGSPQFVSFKSTTYEKPRTLLINNSHSRKGMYNLTVCAHGSLRNNFSNTKVLMEWFEMYLIFGADKFAIYNYTRSIDLKPLFEYFIKQDVLDLYDISTPSDVKSPDPAQMVIIQDCIYRYMYQTK